MHGGEMRDKLLIFLAGIKALEMACEIQPENYEDWIALKGMGPKRIRALALISELIYGAETCWKDPAKYSFAHGGKDGYPYPVDRETFDHSISTLKEALENAKLDRREKYDAIKRLNRYISADCEGGVKFESSAASESVTAVFGIF
ncbi:MAG: DUF763 domain-containing protein [Methanothrix harundinacea]|jgi:hypothetical protein|nr:DUF763 domain-containing protein [Methanothrix harundinacea]